MSRKSKSVKDSSKSLKNRKRVSPESGSGERKGLFEMDFTKQSHEHLSNDKEYIIGNAPNYIDDCKHIPDMVSSPTTVEPSLPPRRKRKCTVPVKLCTYSANPREHTSNVVVRKLSTPLVPVVMPIKISIRKPLHGNPDEAYAEIIKAPCAMYPQLAKKQVMSRRRSPRY